MSLSRDNTIYKFQTFIVKGNDTSASEQPVQTTATSFETATDIGNAIDCKWSDYGEWSICSSTCGVGTQRRVRIIIQPAVNGGAECTKNGAVAANSMQIKNCSRPVCAGPSYGDGN